MICCLELGPKSLEPEVFSMTGKSGNTYVGLVLPWRNLLQAGTVVSHGVTVPSLQISDAMDTGWLWMVQCGPCWTG